MTKLKKKNPKGAIVSIYVKPIDLKLFQWAKKQRQSLSEIVALALQEYKDKHDK